MEFNCIYALFWSFFYNNNAVELEKKKSPTAVELAPS